MSRRQACRNPRLLQRAARAPSAGIIVRRSHIERPVANFATTLRGQYETSPSHFLEPCSGCCCAAGRFADRECASLSDAASAYYYGQTGDISARLLGQWLSDRLGQPFVIENRPGASSSIATELVVHAPPDGYTLLWVVTSNYINATLRTNLPYNFIGDIEPVASTTRSTLVAVVNPSVPVKTVPELILTPRLIRASSTWLREASATRRTWLVSCSR